MPIQRRSKKRDAILELLRGTDRHPSASWIYSRMRERFPDVSLGTIYRNLSQLVEEGLVRSVGVVDGQERFDGRVEPHDHFICRKCGAVLDLPGRAAEVDLDALGGRYGFTPSACELRVYGTCKDCGMNQPAV